MWQTRDDRLDRFEALTTPLEREVLWLHTSRLASEHGYTLPPCTLVEADLDAPLSHEPQADVDANRASIHARLYVRDRIEEHVIEKMMRGAQRGNACDY